MKVYFPAFFLFLKRIDETKAFSKIVNICRFSFRFYFHLNDEIILYFCSPYVHIPDDWTLSDGSNHYPNTNQFDIPYPDVLLQYGFPNHKPNLQGQGSNGLASTQCADQSQNIASVVTPAIIDGTTTESAIYAETEAPVVRQRRSAPFAQSRASTDDEGKERMTRQQQFS